jgi:transcriptional regulator with PAS, ATPase and Fis domain
VKLLRVLEGREIRKVGDTKYDHVDVRVIAATNANLSTAVNEKTFRKDLYYRLATMPIPVPPLRERPEDIEVLVPYLLERCLAAKEFKAIPEIHPEVIPFLKRQLWPGNVRDLRSCLIRSILQLPEGEILAVERTLLDNSDFKNDTTGISPINIFHEIIRGQRPVAKLSELAEEFGKPFVLRLIALVIRELGKGSWPNEEFTKRFFNESKENFRQWPFSKGYNKEKLLALLA